MIKPFHSFKLEGEPGSIYKKILIDGYELKGVIGATLKWHVDEIPVIQLEMVSPNIEAEDYDGIIEEVQLNEDKENSDRNCPSDNGVCAVVMPASGHGQT